MKWANFIMYLCLSSQYKIVPPPPKLMTLRIRAIKNSKDPYMYEHLIQRARPTLLLSNESICNIKPFMFYIFVKILSRKKISFIKKLEYDHELG